MSLHAGLSWKWDLYIMICINERTVEFLGTFAKFLKATVTFVMSHCLSTRQHETTGLLLHKFSFSLVFEYFRRSVEKIYVLLISDKINWYFTRRRSFMYDNISSNSSWNEIYVRKKKLVKNIKTHFMLHFFFQKLCLLWDNVENMWWSRTGYRWQYNMAHVKNTHAKILILISFPLQQRLRERSFFLLCRYTAYLVIRKHGVLVLCHTIGASL
jgi:hypothetical protein